MMILPNGSQLALAKLSAAFAVTAISNASAAVATAPAHDIEVKEPFLLSSGWGRLDGRVFRAAAVTSGSITIDGVDTTDVGYFPAGGGLGSARGVTSWTEITQMLDFQTSGGDPQFWSYTFMEDPEGNERQMPTGKSAMSLTVTLGDDPEKPWYDALSDADEDKEVTILRLRLPNKSLVYFPSYVSFNKIPKLTSKQGMTVSAAFSFSAAPTRYKTL